MNLSIRLAVASATALTLAGALVGCSTAQNSGHAGMTGMSGMGSPSAAAPAPHNAQDVAFAQLMIAHHQGAIRMAELAATRATSPEVRKLAQSIRDAQSPEIREMSGWLRSWGAPMAASGPSTSPMPDPAMSGMDMGAPMASGVAGGMPGTGPDDMTALEDAEGAEFDKAFLTLMVQHHQGAVDMAQAEISSGQSTQALRLARSIAQSQAAEITRMTSVLDGMS